MTANDCGERPTDLDRMHADEVAAEWVPNLPGESTITLSATWTGTWTYTYFDPVTGPQHLGTYDLGTITVTSEPFTYDVYEIVTVGTSSR